MTCPCSQPSLVTVTAGLRKSCGPGVTKHVCSDISKKMTQSRQCVLCPASSSCRYGPNGMKKRILSGLSCSACLAWPSDAFVLKPPSRSLFCCSSSKPGGIFIRRIRNTRGHPHTVNNRSSLFLARPILSENDLATPPDRRVIQAVEDLEGTQIIASDIASTAGVSLSTAQKSLAALAALTRGTVAVTSEGTLVYTFPKNISSVLASNSQRYRIIHTLQRLWPTIFGGIRITFGLILYLQIFIVFASLLFASASITSSSSSSSNNDDDRRGGGFRRSNTQMNIGLWELNMAMDLLWKSNTYSSSDSSQDSNILSSIFSFVFGDGNPNQGIDDARLKAATQLIRKNGGVVIAEQLIPLLEITPPLDDSTESLYVDENYVLPIVSQLGGEPMVSEDGDILYFFPDLLISTEASILADAGLSPNATNNELKRVLAQRNVDTKFILEKQDLIQLLEKSLYSTTLSSNNLSLEKKLSPTPIEKEIVPFNRNNPQANVIAGLLGVVNLLGTIKLNQMLTSPILTTAYRLPLWYTVVQSALPLLMTYAIGFSLIPIIRVLSNQIQNKMIQRQNEERMIWFQRIQQGSSMLRRKLTAAASIKSNIRRLSRDKFIYDTNLDSSFLKQEKDSASLKEFDKRLSGGDESSSID